jgi:hypothetical protein
MNAPLRSVFRSVALTSRSIRAWPTIWRSRMENRDGDGDEDVQRMKVNVSHRV